MEIAEEYRHFFSAPRVSLAPACVLQETRRAHTRPQLAVCHFSDTGVHHNIS